MDNPFQQQMQQGLEQYHQTKPDGDIDLVAVVRKSLVDAGLLQHVIAAYDSHRWIQEAKNRPSAVQRFLLNRYWHSQLISAQKPSIEERYCLIPNGTIEDWIRLFNQKVLPFVVENNLPKNL